MKNIKLTISVLCALVSAASAAVITPDMSSLAIYAGKDLWLGSGSVVNADIAAVGSITTGSGTQLKGLYTENLIWLSKDNKVNGRVLANLAAEASKNLEFTGPSWTGKSVYMDSGANVTGDIIAGAGNLELNTKAVITGNLNGNDDIWIGNYGQVSGDASPGLQGKLSTGKKVTIGGSTDPSYAAYDTVSLDSMGPAPDVHSYGSQNIYGGNKAVMDLSAGDYKDVDMWGTKTQLNLSSGTYTLRDFWVGNQGTVNVDATAGDVVLNVHKSFSVGNDVTFNVLGEGQFAVNVFEDNVNLGNNVDLAAQIRAWGGDVNTGDDLAFLGTIQAAGGVSIGSRGAVTYSKQTPEPTTAMLLALGAVTILWEERRKHRHIRGGLV
ncbi:MAG: hypothetical protein JW849_09200 [Phycisphaerae bacterium]|nr:hypothetical protein [Phycisphaerae bacterium]